MIVNQQQNNSQWTLLGTVIFNQGTPYTVTLSGLANGSVVADAVRVVPAGPGPTADAYTKSSSPSSNFGTSSTMRLENGSTTEWGFMRFDLSSTSGTITSAILHLGGHGPSGTTSIGVYPVSDTTWGENTITWNNQPAIGASAITTATINGPSNAWYTLDITQYAAAEKLAGRNLISLAFKGSGATGSEWVFNTREASSFNPYLSLTSVPGLYFIHADHLNTPRLVADSTGTTVWRRDNQEPFGDSPADENPSGLGVFEFDLGFPGQRRDRETGLWYNDQRDGYNSAIGGYTQPEPMGITGDINLYRYARGNPVRFIDPDGRFAFVIPALPALGAAFAEAAVAVAGLVGGAAIANAIQNSSAASEKKKGVEEWNKAVPSMPGLYTCRYVMYFPADQCEDGKCPPFVTGRGYDATLKGAMAQARQEAQSKIPSGCSHQHHGQMWCRYGSSPPFMP